MSADELREAAAMMRKQANEATPGRWKLWGMQVCADQDGTSNYETSRLVAMTSHEAGLFTFNAQHIASWDPPVAFAVAAWLEAEAASLDAALPVWRGDRYPDREALGMWAAFEPPPHGLNDPEWVAKAVEHHYGKALAVARAYLRKSS